MQPAVSFYIYSILGIVILPLLPLTIATGISAGITAVSSRMRHKSVVAASLTILLCLIIIGVSMLLPENAQQITVEMIKDMAAVMTEQIGKLYPPSVWFGTMAVQGKTGGFLLFAGASILIFVILIAVLQKYFMTVCAALNATSAKNNYKMQSLSASSPIKALWKRELKRYFASSIYVTNTLIGYILMLMMSVGLFIAGPEKIEEVMQMPGVITKALPLVLTLMAVIMPTTACSVSLEGKQWWIAQTLPVKSGDIWKSKILVNLTLALPFYVATVIFGILAVKPTLMEGVWIALIPLAYILFTAVAGITVNLAVPVFNWENEARAVKQSASTMVTMLVGFAGVVPPFVCVFALGEGAGNLVYAVTTVILLGLTTVLYVRNGKKSVIL